VQEQLGESEDVMKELEGLYQEKFDLEQCVRYLSSRCQMYQIIWKGAEGSRKTPSRPVVRQGASSSSGEIHPEGSQRPDASIGSGSSRAGWIEEGPVLTRNLELKLINKIASICEPFCTRRSESMSSRTYGLREASTFAS